MEYITLIMREREKYNEGKEEEKYRTARSIIELNMATDFIIQVTGLPIEEIEKICKERYQNI